MWSMQTNNDPIRTYSRRIRLRMNEILGTVMLTCAALGFLLAALFGGGVSGTSISASEQAQGAVVQR